MKRDGKLPLETLAEGDDLVGTLQELIHLIESGELPQGAIRFRLEDGSESEFVFGAVSEEERELLLATLQAQLETKH